MQSKQDICNSKEIYGLRFARPPERLGLRNLSAIARKITF
jgi:hypothetical protein